MPLNFTCMSHFTFKLFLSLEIPLMFTSVITRTYSIKINHNQAKNSVICGVFDEILTGVFPFGIMFQH